MLGYVTSIDIWRVKLKKMERIIVFLVLFMCATSVSCEKKLNVKTCAIRETPSFIIYEMDCTFEGSDTYTYEGPSSVHTLTMDRLTVDSILVIPSMTTLSKVTIENGDAILCTYVKAPAHVTVYIGSLLCVSIHK